MLRISWNISSILIQTLLTCCSKDISYILIHSTVVIPQMTGCRCCVFSVMDIEKTTSLKATQIQRTTFNWKHIHFVWNWQQHMCFTCIILRCGKHSWTLSSIEQYDIALQTHDHGPQQRRAYFIHVFAIAYFFSLYFGYIVPLPYFDR